MADVLSFPGLNILGHENIYLLVHCVDRFPVQRSFPKRSGNPD